MGVLVHFGKSYIYFGNRVPAVLIMLVELLKDACPFLFDMMTWKESRDLFSKRKKKLMRWNRKYKFSSEKF